MSSITRKIRTPPTSPRSGKIELLLVEDEVALARIIAKTLAECCEVTVVHDGHEASGVVTKKSFDVVLSDVVLPGISGIELLRLIRTYDLDVPVILMTGLPSFEDIRSAMELGAMDYMIKAEVSNEQIRERIRKAATLGKLARTKRKALELVAGGAPTMGIGDRAGLAACLEKALGGIYMVFQPIADPRAKRVVAFEALMRSTEPSLPNPLAILDAAEQLNQVENVGRRVREQVASLIPTLPANADVFVNIHTRELLDERLYGAECPLAAHAQRVVLEVTERERVETVVDAKDRAAKLRSLGFRLAVDDLGAGYAGLTTFTVLEPEIVKIDRALVHGISLSVPSQRVVRSVVTLCREMSTKVVAEGIETAADLAAVMDLGCDFVQGYIVGKPSKKLITRVPQWWF